MINPEKQAAWFTAQGYRRTSNRYRIISRIDRPDWVKVLAEQLMRAPADFYVPGENKPCGSWADFYRRVHSKDKIEGVPDDVFKLIPSSGHDPCGYVGKEADEAVVEKIKVEVPPGWLPTAKNINALPNPVRDYIHRLETNADPSGMVRENTLRGDQVKQLEATLEEITSLYSKVKNKEWIWIVLTVAMFIMWIT